MSGRVIPPSPRVIPRSPRVIPSEVEGSPASRPEGDPSTDARDDTRWRNLYAFVIFFLALQVLFYYLFTKAFE
jgi:hypothetical protein